MSITNTQSLTARLALLTTLVSGTLMLNVGPAAAKSYVVAEPGRAKIGAGLVECKQFIMERDGADIVNFQVVPRIEKEKTKTFRYRDKRTGKNRTGTKKVPVGLSINNSPWENRQYGGRNQNARVSTGSFQRPSDPWTYRRRVEGHGRYRCVAIVTYLAKDADGKLYARRGVRVEGPWVNSSHR